MSELPPEAAVRNRALSPAPAARGCTRRPRQGTGLPRSGPFPAWACSGPDGPLHSAPAACICTSISVSKRFRHSITPITTLSNIYPSDVPSARFGFLSITFNSAIQECRPQHHPKCSMRDHRQMTSRTSQSRRMRIRNSGSAVARCSVSGNPLFSSADRQPVRNRPPPGSG